MEKPPRRSVFMSSPPNRAVLLLRSNHAFPFLSPKKVFFPRLRKRPPDSRSADARPSVPTGRSLANAADSLVRE
jgi:hypothetical protein